MTHSAIQRLWQLVQANEHRRMASMAALSHPVDERVSDADVDTYWRSSYTRSITWFKYSCIQEVSVV